MNDQWSDNLRKRMETHQEPSPEGLWEDIEKIIQKEQLPKQQKVLLWSKRIGAVAAIAAIVLVIGYYAISDQRQDNMQLAIATPQKQDVHERKANVPDHKNDMTAQPESLLFSQQTRRATVEKVSVDTVILTAKEEDKISQEIKTKDDSPESDSNKERIVNEHLYANSERILTSDSESNLYTHKQKSDERGWSANIYASNLSPASTNKYDGYGSLAINSSYPGGSEEEPALGESPYTDILVQNKYREVYTEVKHKQPLTVGISVNYDIDKKWSITSGLTYTKLSSDLRSGSSSYYYSSEQTLHYIGIPLNINYNIWRGKSLSIYLSGGGKAEKNISGNLATKYTLEDKSESKLDEKISIDQLQWSVNGFMGIQYDVTKKLGLYVEPGVSHHFKNNSEIETIYKEKPTNFSLQIGLRFSLNK